MTPKRRYGYRSKTEEVEAFQWHQFTPAEEQPSPDGVTCGAHGVMHWCGRWRVCPGNWIVYLPNACVEVMPDADFRAQYEEVPEAKEERPIGAGDMVEYRDCQTCHKHVVLMAVPGDRPQLVLARKSTANGYGYDLCYARPKDVTVLSRCKPEPGMVVEHLARLGLGAGLVTDAGDSPATVFALWMKHGWEEEDAADLRIVRIPEPKLRALLGLEAL